MKFRSILLIALMVIVPALAMFSHQLPSGMSASVTRFLITPMMGWVASWRGATGPERGGRIARLEPLVEPAPATSAPHSITEADRSIVRERLREMGATEVECRQLSGAAAGHVASCRVALDANGQLQRLFQATGHDSLAAERRLLEEIVAWHGRRTVAD